MTNLRLLLDDLRSALIRQEETIIFALIERGQFKLNARIYERNAIPIPDYDGDFAGYLLQETERGHAKVRRYTSPEEEPFFDGLPEPLLPSQSNTPSPIRQNNIRVNPKILALYRQHVLPIICSPGDDGHYGSSAVCDVSCLQALSKRIHYGKFIAEAKYQSEPDVYDEMIRNNDANAIRDRLTVPAVEARLLERVRQKAAAYGQDLDGLPAVSPTVKIRPDALAAIYRDQIIPLTIDVEVDYLLACYGS